MSNVDSTTGRNALYPFRLMDNLTPAERRNQALRLTSSALALADLIGSSTFLIPADDDTHNSIELALCSLIGHLEAVACLLESGGVPKDGDPAE